jgi:aminoglycoside/choline kinase family phosphotransferase
VLRQGKSYSALAHLAEDMTAFIAIDKGLQAAGIRVPDIYAYDVKKGLALLEDLGSGSCVDHDGPMVERYQEAVSVLAHLHHQNLPDRIRVDDIDYQIPVYDMEAQLIEVELFLDWYVPYILKKELSSAARALFISQWRNILSQCMDQPLQWVLRDYHSPNLLWCEEAEGLARIGVIDFQDCVRGHPAYDVVSLLQDARVSVPDEMELKLLAHYIRLRRPDPQFNFLKFTVAYAVLGAQRATKILGIFARLDQRDGKPHYLAHLPRVEAYFRKNIGHIAFQSLREWFATYLPDYALSTQPKTEIKDGA